MRRPFEALAEGVFDLLVVGGGITGVGVALDATLRGLKVALVEKGDFAGGTSSASSKLIHGGLRYLEHGQFHLVYEALAERRRLLRNAPHLVRPLRFVLPFYRDSRMPRWKGRTGLFLYDLLAGRHNLRTSRGLSAATLAREFPGLKTTGLVGGAEFYDAQMDDARLCLEVVRTAINHGAVAFNYTAAVAVEPGAVRVRHSSGRELTVRVRQVLNAAGPWTDSVERLAGGEPPPHLQPTKGVHLVAPSREFAAAFLLLHPADGRVFFVIPWMGRTLIGTTDTFSGEPPDRLAVQPAEVAYLLEGFNRHFDPPLSAADVCGSFAGLRPLLRSRPGDPSARSREFAVWDGPAGLLSVAGGKYTTYRRMAEVVTDMVCRKLGVRRRSRTRSFRLDGAPEESWDVFRARERAALGKRGIDAPLADHLIGRYGRRARDVARVLLRDPELMEEVAGGEPERIGELVYQREREYARTPADHLFRRTRLGLYRPDLTEADVEKMLGVTI